MIRNILVLMAFLVLCVIVAWLGMSRCRSPKVGDEEVARVIFCSRPQALSRSDLDDRRQGIAKDWRDVGGDAFRVAAARLGAGSGGGRDESG